MKKTFTRIRTVFPALALALMAGLLLTSSPAFAAVDTPEEEPAVLMSGEVVTYNDTERKDLDDPNVTYVIKGNGRVNFSGNYFRVPAGKSSYDSPITIILDNVLRSQDDEDPGKSFITIEKDNYVVVKLRGESVVIAGKNEQFGSDDGMAGIHVSYGATVKVTSEEGDGSTQGTLRIRGGGDTYGGAAIGTRYNEDCGHVVIAGGTIEAYGGHSAAGIGSGRDGCAKGTIEITGGKIYAEGGKYAAGIGAGDNVGPGEGGDLYDLKITGGDITAVGGYKAAGIGCSEGGNLRGVISIRGATITATGGEESSGIGGGSGASFDGSGRIYIRSGNITATGGAGGAGIGGGGGDGTSNTSIEIDQFEGEELSIYAQGGSGAAGIGSGNVDCNYVKIELRGGTIEAHGGKNAAGIGSGDDVRLIRITGTGTVKAYGGRNGAGIGAGNDAGVGDYIQIEGDTTIDGTTVPYGYRGADVEGGRGLTITAVASDGRQDGEYENEAAAIGSGKATGGDIVIKNATLYTKADCQGADIGGGGYHVTPSGTVKNITIDNCDITSTSTRKVAPGIGAGYGGSVNNIVITNTKYTGCGIGGAPMDINYIGLNSVDSITIENSDIYAKWDESNPGRFVGEITPGATPLDHGVAGIGSGQYGSVDAITIKDSKIYAHGYGSGAGIGSGGAGGQNFSLIPLMKLDIGDVGTITITGSHVEAISGCADFRDQPPAKLYDGYFTYEEIDMIDFGGGAGIGSGSASGVEIIDIEDCDYVYALGYKGAGIGGGCGTGVVKGGWVDSIFLVNNKHVEAYAGEWCAGIGTGGGNGLDDSTRCTLWEIYINNCGIKAEGGYTGAGIGLGGGSKYVDNVLQRGSSTLTIIDSTIEARGGGMAAGIGGGFEERGTRKGGENPPMEILGKCRIDAYGGNHLIFEEKNGVHGGGAGIGGGCCGACTTIVIDLEEDETTPRGTLTNPGLSNWYVHAVGGTGAAGIGAGGNEWIWRTTTDVTKNHADSDTIIIKGGAIFAQGGDSHPAAGPDYADFYLGAGCGIGGASAESKIKNLTINGGYIIARGGGHQNENDRADDIGTGGDYSNENDNSHRSSDKLTITDGTIIADNISNFSDKAVVSGGSVSGVVNNAKNNSGKPVYRTAVLDVGASGTKALVQPAEGEYGSDSVYVNINGCLYVYLQESQYQTADVTAGGVTNHYVGWTNRENTGQLQIPSDESDYSSVSATSGQLPGKTEVQKPEVVTPVTAMPFEDVPVPGEGEDSQASEEAEAIRFVYVNGIMNGVSETSFAPDMPLNRAQLATILYRMAGCPELTDGDNFRDIEEGQFYTNPVAWAKQNAIFTGYQNGDFSPAEEVTREQLAVVFYRYAERIGLNTEAEADLSACTDAEVISPWAAKAVAWAVGNGILPVGEDGRLYPQGEASRGECAFLIMQFMEKTAG